MASAKGFVTPSCNHNDNTLCGDVDRGPCHGRCLARDPVRVFALGYDPVHDHGCYDAYGRDSYTEI
ncbi:hypothetical protein RvY_11356 [Ramazzottius varieornatus]|uniref:Uncharacterized protein n=1 Tax=Ramazzottius varieornatus TaxID=947166 RepID=A0A1D1VK79_RAMVA|nr:hypothetical protein RvY_11356 [Ramazzottius varieornatus]